MQIVRDSNLEEYVQYFWLREQAKNGQGGGDDPLGKLAHEHPYKLPFGCSDPTKGRIQLVCLDHAHEVVGLVIHDYMVKDKWMQQRQLRADSRRLGDIADTFLQAGYFEKPSHDTQYRNFHTWRSSGSLQNCIGAENRPLIQDNGGELEIVDGWGRLLPFVALVKGGMTFYPVECFLASERKGDRHEWR